MSIWGKVSAFLGLDGLPTRSPESKSPADHATADSIVFVPLGWGSMSQPIVIHPRRRTRTTVPTRLPHVMHGSC